MITSKNVTALNELKIMLKNGMKKVRLAALNELEKHIIDLNSTFHVSPEEILELLIHMFNDEAEVCREKAVKLVFHHLSTLKTMNNELRSSILFSIKDRLGKEIIKEPSEEVRCLLLKLLSLLISSNTECVALDAHNVTSIYLSCVNDSCPDVIMCALKLLEISIETSPDLFRECHDEILASLEICVKHKQSRIRIQSINSLKMMLQYCSRETVYWVCRLLGECLLDQNIGVRVSVLRVTAYWMLTVPFKYSYASCMIPLLLSLLADESEECREEAITSWNKIGLNYLNDSKESTGEMNEFLAEEILQSELGLDKFNYGCCLLVQKQIFAIVPVLVEELDNWKVDVRIKSAKLLKMSVTFAGSSVIPFLNTLLPVMLKKCVDENETVSRNVMETAEVVGRVVPTTIYWRLIKENLSNGCSLNHLIILSSFLKFAGDAEIVEVVNDAAFLFTTIQLSGLDDAKFQELLLEVFSQLLLRCKGVSLDTNTAYNIFVILLTILGFTDPSNQIQMLDSLRLASGFHSVTQLGEYNFTKLYQRFLENCPLWQMHSTDFKIFLVSLRHFSDDVLLYVPDAFIQILNIILHFEFDKEVRFRSLFIMAEAMECGFIDIHRHSSVMEKFMLGPLKQQLIWRSGKIVEVIRSVALRIFNLVVKHSPLLSTTFLQEFIPLLICLCDDGYEETRLGALNSFTLCYSKDFTKKIDFITFTQMLTAVVGLLEDESDKVRLTAISALKKIFFNASNLEIEAVEEFPDFSKTIQRLFVLSSYDDNIEVQNELQDMLKNPVVLKFFRKFCPEKELTALIDNCFK